MFSPVGQPTCLSRARTVTSKRCESSSRHYRTKTTRLALARNDCISLVNPQRNHSEYTEDVFGFSQRDCAVPWPLEYFRQSLDGISGITGDLILP